MNHFLLIFLGGGLGAVSRYSLTLFMQSPASRMPWGILTCNLLGSLLIGVVYGMTKTHQPAWLSPLAVTGFLGGFTTFSTFALDTHKHLEAGFPHIAALYIGISLIGGITLCYLGYRLAA